MSALVGRPEDVIELWTRNGPCKIELLSGDITQLSKDDMLDIIMISAFPGDYAAMSGTVIGALKYKLGINVMHLSQNKELDLRSVFSCWLSKPIMESSSPFKKLLCFERKRGSHLSIHAQVSEMFRVFVPVFNNQDHTVITPLLATGHQGKSKTVMCGTMVEAAAQWINAGLPLRQFKIVIYEGISDEIETVFTALKKKHLAKNAKMKDRIFTKRFDVFVTFNPVDQDYMQKVKQNLEKKKTDIKLYTNTSHFNQDKVWQDDIFKIMVACKRIIAILSPAFMESSECLEQYNMAMCCNRLLGTDVLSPFYVDTIKSLPSYMGLVQWIDCRVRKEGDSVDAKIQSACGTIILATEEYDSGNVKIPMLPAADSDNQPDEKFDFDVFISYSHKNPTHAETLLKHFNKIDPSLKVFYDRSALTTGTNWQNMLYQSVGECRCFIALLSSTYLSSTVCLEEFNLAQARYMCKDKDLMLIPVCIENLETIPRHMSTVQMMEACEDYDQSATQLATSVVEWLRLTADNRPSLYIAKDAVDIESIMSAQRCEKVREQYKVVSENNFERVDAVVKPTEEDMNTDSSKVDVAVSYANDATHLAGSFCIMLNKLYPDLNMNVHTNSDQERYSALDTARKIVIFVSKDFLRNEHHMQELHLALNRQRPLEERILYLIQATPLTGRPFFPRILQYSVSCIDTVWKDFEKAFLGKKSGKDVTRVTVFGKRRILEHAFTFTCSRAEYFALTKAVDDVLESFVKQGNKKQMLGPLLLNVKALENGHKPTGGSNEEVRPGHTLESDVKTGGDKPSLNKSADKSKDTEADKPFLNNSADKDKDSEDDKSSVNNSADKSKVTEVIGVHSDKKDRNEQSSLTNITDSRNNEAYVKDNKIEGKTQPVSAPLAEQKPTKNVADTNKNGTTKSKSGTSKSCIVL